jgi:hypothetical protein
MGNIPGLLGAYHQTICRNTAKPRLSTPPPYFQCSAGRATCDSFKIFILWLTRCMRIPSRPVLPRILCNKTPKTCTACECSESREAPFRCLRTRPLLSLRSTSSALVNDDVRPITACRTTAIRISMVVISSASSTPASPSQHFRRYPACGWHISRHLSDFDAPHRVR